MQSLQLMSSSFTKSICFKVFFHKLSWDAVLLNVDERGMLCSLLVIKSLIQVLFRLPTLSICHIYLERLMHVSHADVQNGFLIVESYVIHVWFSNGCTSVLYISLKYNCVI